MTIVLTANEYLALCNDKGNCVCDTRGSAAAFLEDITSVAVGTEDFPFLTISWSCGGHIHSVRKCQPFESKMGACGMHYGATDSVVGRMAGSLLVYGYVMVSFKLALSSHGRKEGVFESGLCGCQRVGVLVVGIPLFSLHMQELAFLSGACVARGGQTTSRQKRACNLH